MLKYIFLSKEIFISSFNLLIGIGLIAGLLFFEKDVLKRKIDSNSVNKIKTSFIFVLILAFLGALIFDALFKGISLNYKNNVGFTFYGGLIFGLIVLYLTLRIQKVNLQIGFNLIIPVLIISHSFGRVGCFMAGCCYGKPTNSIFGVKFPIDSFPWVEYKNCIAIHPTQLYEAFFLLIIFFICIHFISFNNRIIFYLVSYGIIRFCIEFFRSDDRGTIFNQTIFSPSQIISLVLVLVGLFLLLRKHFYINTTIYHWSSKTTSDKLFEKL